MQREESALPEEGPSNTNTRVLMFKDVTVKQGCPNQSTVTSGQREIE